MVVPHISGQSALELKYQVSKNETDSSVGGCCREHNLGRIVRKRGFKALLELNQTYGRAGNIRNCTEDKWLAEDHRERS